MRLIELNNKNKTSGGSGCAVLEFSDDGDNAARRAIIMNVRIVCYNYQ